MDSALRNIQLDFVLPHRLPAFQLKRFNLRFIHLNSTAISRRNARQKCNQLTPITQANSTTPPLPSPSRKPTIASHLQPDALRQSARDEVRIFVGRALWL